ncbi:M15 family peptidase [Methylobacterium currus]|uniref:M15 family peptidase n=2 Tax=Methylobacterium currus TaxID=2051553 RepID=A0A2R4WTD6_9HYPH|nr:M15 family peptidase [Methylobacterium currus]
MGRVTGGIRRMLGLGGGEAAGGGAPGIGAQSGLLDSKGASPEVVAYIRQRAAALGIDPDTAVAVANTEGLRGYKLDGKKDGGGDNGMSFGPYQMFYGGGLGNEFTKRTGLHASDKSTYKQQIDFALEHAAKNGWGAFHGAGNNGIGNWAGIGGRSGSAPGRGSANHMQGQYGAAGTNLTTITTASGKKVTVHAAAAESFKNFIDELEGTGYKIDSLGGYNYRTKRNGTGLSQHAYGNAIDINPLKNPMTNGKLITDLPPNISDLAAKHGLSWGGDWKRTKDAMHFEWTGRNPKDAAPQSTPKAAPQAWWRGAPGAMASVSQAREAQAAQIGRQMNDNRSNSTTTNSTHIGSVTVQTAATDASGIARDMEESLKRRSFVAAATTGQA